MSTPGTDEKRPGIGIAVFVTHNSKPNCVILGKRKNGLGAGLYQLPGGKLEFGESFEEGAHREVFEETGLHLKNIEYTHTVNSFYPEFDYHYVTVFMKAEIDDSESNWISEPQNLEPNKNEWWRWVQWNELPSTEGLFWCFRDFMKTGINPFKKLQGL
ncbi:hypothetical protein JTE90_001574 [Oedothorax gibbosus]|uniref:Nucleotide triphosphate diphosphatase NUDT15 n=1 Tax=Oedothorax gibbosus TaxID=931172 RepID=A0AAV6VM76_9ARAC|nr:hypothetical protein JTE90_001574 [Oedothorax gibbosus]